MVWNTLPWWHILCYQRGIFGVEGVMPSSIRTAHLGVAFIEAGRSILIAYSRSKYSCACGLPSHFITRGDLFVGVTKHPSGVREHWNLEHLQDWKLILIDRSGNELARFGC